MELLCRQGEKYPCSNNCSDSHRYDDDIIAGPRGTLTTEQGIPFWLQWQRNH